MQLSYFFLKSAVSLRFTFNVFYQSNIFYTVKFFASLTTKENLIKIGAYLTIIVCYTDPFNENTFHYKLP